MAKAPAPPAVAPPAAAKRAATVKPEPAEVVTAATTSEKITRNAVVIIAVIATGCALWLLRGILTPLALAMFMAIMVDSFARRLEQQWPRLPDALSLLAAILLSLVIFGVSAIVVAANAADFAGKLDIYQARLDELIVQFGGVFRFLGGEAPDSVADLIRRGNPTQALSSFANGLRGFGSDALFVLIYLGFIIAARGGFKRKIVALFPNNRDRDEAVLVFNRIRFGVERYLWVQTVTGLMIAAGSWLGMTALGLDNALFWAFLIFLASYIPIIGGIVGVAFPVVFALLQFQNPLWAVVLFAVLQTIQAVVGNIITPRMQGDSLNIDPVVVLLSLAAWGLLWGLPGMFLSTPLSVMAMIILAEFRGSRWIAILMSENGDPQGVDDKGHRRGKRLFGESRENT